MVTKRPPGDQKDVDSNSTWCKMTQNDENPIELIIPEVNKYLMEGEFPFEMRFGAFGPNDDIFCNPRRLFSGRD